MAGGKPQRIEIARIEDQHAGGAILGVIGVLMLIIGAIVMSIEVLTETSAVKLGAYGAVWTGYNVFWGMVVAAAKRTILIVTREAPSE